MTYEKHTSNSNRGHPDSMGSSSWFSSRLDGFGRLEVWIHRRRHPRHWVAMGPIYQMTNAEIDDMYEFGDLLMQSGRWSVLDDLLEFYADAAWRMPLDMLITWATITLPAKSKLKNRGRFIEACLKFHSDPNQPSLWQGLE